MPFPLIDPDARLPLTIRGYPGVTFFLRSIPYGRWSLVRSSLLLSIEKAKRRAVRDLLAEGMNPEDRPHPESTATIADMRANTDPTAALEISGLNRELVRWGLASVEGLELGATPFVLATEETTFDGVPAVVVTAAALRILEAQPGLVSILSTRIWSANEIGPDEKKD